MNEDAQYDALLGGDQELPSSFNLLQFTAARCKEIQAMKQSLSSSKGSKLAFQKLPKHMRRRAMSHNAKRLPRRLRQIHLNQLKKSGMPPKIKKVSRKYRRRPKNLMEEYTRRQRKHKWLETHIWHAKRFHMVERWGYRLPESPCDKAFRACYRATAKHCLLQDISYITCLQLCGKENILIDKLKEICDSNVGLSIGAKAYIRGSREGETTLYKYNVLPKEAIGSVYFNWKPKNTAVEDVRSLWIWVHASYYKDVLTTLIDLFDLRTEDSDNLKFECYQNNSSCVILNDLKCALNRFRLTGPLSQAVLQKTLKPVNPKVTKSQWLQHYLNDECTPLFTTQMQYWQNIENISSPAQLPPHIIVSLIATDPRYSFPKQRTKAVSRNMYIDSKYVHEVPESISVSPLWDRDVRQQVKESKISNAKIAEMRSELLVPGTDLEEPGAPVPYILIQRPGNRDDKLGYCSGWDLLMPSGWAQATWITLVMWGARAGGLRETDSVCFEMGKPSFLAPDTTAGKVEEQRQTEIYKHRYFSLPPNKRTNYNKFAMVSPFKCDWNVIIGDWKNFSEPVDDFFVLRDKKLLQKIQDSLLGKSESLSNLKVDYTLNCIIPIRLKLDKRGCPKLYSIICLATPADLNNRSCLAKEPLRVDENQAVRKTLRDSHKLLLKSLRKKRIKAKQKGKSEPADVEMLTKYRDKMRELWLPEAKRNIRQSCSREVIGFVTKGEFSFTVAHSAAVGYIAIGALHKLLSLACKNKVLIRNTTSRQYHIATLEIICNV